jgi:hypothetical protein
MNDWQRVGLEAPTNDLAIIKRAYAKKLRATRPDDDAAAYQALRESYDRLVSLAKWQASHPVVVAEERPQADALRRPPPVGVSQLGSGPSLTQEPIIDAPPALADEPALTHPPAPRPAQVDEQAPAPAPAALGPEAAPQQAAPRPQAQADNTGTPEPQPPSPEALCHWVLALHTQGVDALEAALPELRRELHALPLKDQLEASVRFADLVLKQRRLPMSLQMLLQAHFGWLDDFRTVRQLGVERAADLHATLGDLPRLITEPVTLGRHAETLAINALLDKRRSLWALFVTTLMGFFLQHQVATAGPQLLRRLGLSPPRQARLATLMTQAQWLRTGAVIVAVFAVGLIFARDIEGALWGTAGTVALGLIGPFLIAWKLGLLYWLRQRGRLPSAWALRMGLHKLQSATPWIGVGLVLAASGGLWLAQPQDLPLGFVAACVIGLIGLTLALPETLAQGLVAASVWIYTLAAFDIKSMALMGVVAAWVLAGMHVYLQAVYRPDGHEDRLTIGPPRGGRMAELLLATVGLPTFLAWVADKAGFRLVLAALVLATSPALMRHALSGFYAMPGALWLAVVGMLWVQAAALRLARRITAPPAH